MPGILSGEQIDWAQMGTDMVRDIIFNLVLEAGGRLTESGYAGAAEADTATGTKTGKTETAPETVLGSAMTEINRVYNKVVKRGKNVNVKIADIDSANNAHVDFASGKGDAGTAAMKIVESIDQTIASGNLLPEETARLKEIRAEVEPYVEIGDVDVSQNIGDNGNSDIINSLGAKKSGLSQTIINKIISVKKGEKPDPLTYLTKESIATHLSMFEGGVTKIKANPPKDVEGIGLGTFVIPRSVADEAIAKANGDFRLLEELLALEPGSLGSNPVRVDISNPKNVRIPTGNEVGALFDYWVPGGYTKGGIMEAVIDPVKPEDYIVTQIK